MTSELSAVPAHAAEVRQIFVPLSAGTGQTARVLALPQAGAGCAAFAECAAGLAPDLGLWALNLPGRQARFGEPPVTDLDMLVHDIAAGIEAVSDLPYVLFGYCLGGLFAFLAAREALARDVPPPRALVVASCPAPRRVAPIRTIHTLPSELFWSEVVSWGGFSSGLVAQPGHREIFEPALRADFELLAAFQDTGGPPLPVPVVALAGRHDPVCTMAELSTWAEYTTGRFTAALFGGDHWLLGSALDEVIAVLDRECRR